MVKGYAKLTKPQQERLDRKDWWTHLSDIGFSREDLILRDLADSTDFGESIRHVSAFGRLPNTLRMTRRVQRIRWIIR
ncbi:MAG: hypothetical protein IPP63_04825 [Chloracidobacterium sp.]|nr:hypothetical protein [Chloracidobacterium sp.]